MTNPLDGYDNFGRRIYTSPKYVYYSSIITQPTLPTTNVERPNVKIRKAGTNESVVALLVDASSSMYAKWPETVDAVKAFIKSNAEDEIKTRLFIAMFSGTIPLQVLVDFEYAEEVLPKMDSIMPKAPSGSTNLNDAIAHTFAHVSDKVLKDVKKKDRPTVQLVILTDGQENCSFMYKHDEVKEYVATAEIKNWAMDFIGCDYDASQAGSSYGFSGARTMSYDSQNTAESFRNISAMTSATKSALSTGATVDVIYKDVKYDQNEE